MIRVSGWVCLALLLPLSSWSQQIPQMEVTTLTNQHVVLPVPGSSRPLLVLVTFSHKGGDDAAEWNKLFNDRYETDPRLDYCELADFQGVPSFVMKMILHGMRRAVHEPEKSHLAPFFSQEDGWKKLVDFGDPGVTYVVLADAGGRVVWQTHGPASDGKVGQLEAAIVSLQSRSR